MSISIWNQTHFILVLPLYLYQTGFEMKQSQYVLKVNFIFIQGV